MDFKLLGFRNYIKNNYDIDLSKIFELKLEKEGDLKEIEYNQWKRKVDDIYEYDEIPSKIIEGDLYIRKFLSKQIKYKHYIKKEFGKEFSKILSKELKKGILTEEEINEWIISIQNKTINIPDKVKEIHLYLRSFI